MIDPRQLSDCYARANGARFRVSRERFAEAIEAAVSRAFAGRDVDRPTLSRFVATLHLEDLALACACADGDEEAWEHFVRTYRPALYRAAHAIDPSGGARDLADSLYGDLYGLGSDKSPRRSLFRYFHGRSTLATWLRAVLAQRHIDRMREQRRTAPLPDDDSPSALAAGSAPSPERGRFERIVRAALAHAVALLSAVERLRLSCYYVQRMTLAEVGRLTGEHEATVSRQLARSRLAIRRAIEADLRREHGLSDAAIAECFQTLAADPGGLDVADLLGSKNVDEDRSKDESCA